MRVGLRQLYHLKTPQVIHVACFEKKRPNGKNIPVKIKTCVFSLPIYLGDQTKLIEENNKEKSGRAMQLGMPLECGKLLKKFANLKILVHLLTKWF